MNDVGMTDHRRRKMILSMGAILTRLSITHGRRPLQGGECGKGMCPLPRSVKLWVLLNTGCPFQTTKSQTTILISIREKTFP